MSLEKNIVLYGFMGCGKSTVGKILAQRLTVPFIDMDEYLEAREGMTIPEMFGKLGEAGFRECEHAAALELSRLRGVVLAAGGGALAFEKNAAALRKTGILIFLDASFSECYSRVKDSDRPLVRGNTRESLEQLYLSRRESYRLAADFELASDGLPEEIAEAAIRLLGLK